jgi:hypothetical protein
MPATAPTAIAVPAAAATVKASAKTGLHNVARHGWRRCGDHCRLNRSGLSHSRWSGADGYRSSARRQCRRDVLQSSSHSGTPSKDSLSLPFQGLRPTEAMSSPLTPIHAPPLTGTGATKDFPPIRSRLMTSSPWCCRSEVRTTMHRARPNDVARPTPARPPTAQPSHVVNAARGRQGQFNGVAR